MLYKLNKPFNLKQESVVLFPGMIIDIENVCEHCMVIKHTNNSLKLINEENKIFEITDLDVNIKIPVK